MGNLRLSGKHRYSFVVLDFADLVHSSGWIGPPKAELAYYRWHHRYMNRLNRLSILR